MIVSIVTLRRSAAVPVLALACVLVPASACAQTRLDADYTISLARITIGSASTRAEFGEGRYAITMSGRARGLMRIFASGEGSLTTRGLVADARLSPAEFVARTTTDGDTLDVKLTIADGSVTELSASEPPPHRDRVPLTEAHRRGILDPLTALLLPATAEGLSAVACHRTLAVFDGRRRFDLKLAFKRMDKAKTARGYAGPVVVCSVAFHPIAGHRTSSSMVKYLADGRDIEMALAPVAGVRALAPLRISVANMFGDLVVQAGRFEAISPPSARAGVTTGQAQ